MTRMLHTDCEFTLKYRLITLVIDSGKFKRFFAVISPVGIDTIQDT